MEFAPPGRASTSTNLIGGQITGGSTSVRDGWEKLRKAGATARHLLVAAAAEEWGVNRAQLQGGRWRHHLAAIQEAEVR